MDGVIASAEAQRAAAIAAYGDASTSLTGAAAGTSAMRRGVNFVPSSGDNHAAVNRRRAAASRADSFFSGIADRLDQAVALAAQQVPNQLGAEAEAAKTQIAASMEGQKAAISARIGRARGQARTNAAMARRAVRAQAAIFMAEVEAMTATAIASLSKTQQQTMGKVDALETTTLDSVNQIYADGRSDLEGLGTTIGNECTAKGEEYAATYRGFRHCTENGFWDGDLSERRSEAQENAAREVAKGYHDRMVEAAHKRAREVTRAGRKSDRCSVIASAGQARDTLDTQLTKLTAAMQTIRDAAMSQAQTARDGIISSIDSSLAATLRQLDQQEHDQRQAVDDTGYMQQVLQEQIAHAAAAAVQKGVSTAVTSVQLVMSSLQAQFGSSNPPDAKLLDGALAQVEQRVNTALDGLLTSAGNGASAAQEQLANTTAQALTSLEGIAQSNDEQASTVSGGFAKSMGTIAGTDNFASQRASVTQQFQQGTEAGNGALKQALEGMRKGCDATTKAARTALSQAHAGLEKNLRQSKQGLECEITRKADEAASHEAPAWKKVLAVVLVIIVVVIVIAVTIATAGGALAALGPIATIAAGAAIGAAVGAVTSGLLAVASNLWNNRSWTQGVGKAILIGAITGAIGGFIGAGVGVALKGFLMAVQFGAALVTAGGLDVVTQYVMGGFSFDHFSWTNLGITLIVTVLTLGLAHRVATVRAGGAPVTEGVPAGETAPATEAPIVSETPTVTEAPAVPETAPVTEAPPVSEVAAAPEVAPVSETPPPTPARRGTVTAGPEGIVEHPTSTPEVEVITGRRGARPVAEASATPEEVPSRPTSSAPERSTTQEIRETFSEETATTPETDQGEHYTHADDVREQMNPRTSKSSTLAEREQAIAAAEQDRAARRASLDEESGSHAPEKRPSEMFDDPNAPTESSISTEARESLRAATPPKGAARNEILDEFQSEWGAENGRLRDYATGEPIEGSVTIDHIVPVDEILQMEGFSSLTREQQLEVLNLRENFAPQSARMSSSKGNLPMREWFNTPEGSTIPPSEHNRLINMEDQARAALERAIDARRR